MSDRGFEILSHTADIRMKVWGNTLKELFRNAVRGVAWFLRSDLEELAKSKEKSSVRHMINVEAVDLNSLLIEFLSEVIAQSDIHNSVFLDAAFKKFGENFLEGRLTGLKVDGFEKDIKAVSYHEVDIKKNPERGTYETMLVFDV
jgi:SHS2 domain-containing protein